MIHNLLIVVVSSTLTIQLIISLINIISMFENIYTLYTEKQKHNKIDNQIILEKLSQFDVLIEEWLVKIKQEQNQEKK